MLTRPRARIQCDNAEGSNPPNRTLIGSQGSQARCPHGGGSMKGLRLRTPEKILGEQNPGLSYELLLAEPSTEANLVNQ